jgi:hypothetical protein
MERNFLHGKKGILVANNIRHERTGWHAQIAVVLDNTPLESDNFNIERSEERNRLARRAYEQIAAIDGDGITLTVWTSEQIRKDLLQFTHWIRVRYEETQNQIEGDDMKPVKGINWLISPYVFGDGATTMFAPPKSGKSTVAMAMAISLATGSEHLWEIEEKIPVLWVNLERPPDSVKVRARQLARALGVHDDYGMQFLHRRGHTLTTVGPGIARWVEENPGGFVFLDSISRVGMGKLVEDATANLFADTMHRVAPSGWLGIGHTSKANESSMFGTVMFQASADIEVRLRSQAKEKELGVKLEIASSNHTSKIASMTLAFEYEGDALVSARKANEGEFADIVAITSSNMSRNEKIFDALKELQAATASEIAEFTQIHVSDVSKMLRESANSPNGDFVYVGLRSDKRYGIKYKEV